MTKLKPCPFCGNKKIQRTSDSYKKATIYCYICGANQKWYSSMKIAEEKWNKRHDDRP